MSGGGGRITNRAGRERPRFIRPVERQRMRPWLEEHLDTNDIPGLNWVNKRDKIFRIAWKHAANQCFNLQKDTNLFERWAIHTGRHYDSDHKRWKANFRCALNSLPDVKENKEQGIKKGNNAFKIYKFLDERETRGVKESKMKKRAEYGSDLTLKPNDDDYDHAEGSPGEDGEGSSSVRSIPKLDQLYPAAGLEALVKAGYTNRKPVTDTADDTNLQEILAAATASVAAGSDPSTLENISIDQLRRLGDLSRTRLDVIKNMRKPSSGYMYVFLCKWCEKVFPRKIELFQHFLVNHQDKLLAGEDYGEQNSVDKNDPEQQKLLEEIQDLEQKVLGFSENSYQSSETGSEGVHDSVHDNENVSSEACSTETEEKALDLTLSSKEEKFVPKEETALDLSMGTSKRQKPLKPYMGKQLGKRRRSSQDPDVNYSIKFGNYGIAGPPRTKRQMSLHTRRMEEEQERLAKKITESSDVADTSRQHSIEDIVHAEMLLSLKTGNDEGSENGTGKSPTKKHGNARAGKKGKTPLRKPAKAAKVAADNSLKDNKTDNVKGKLTQKPKKPVPIKAFKCGLCFSKFRFSRGLLDHVRSHQGTYLHKCRNCGEQCATQEDLIHHISSSHPNIAHRCDFCGIVCKTVKKLKNHMWTHICVCELCGEKFYNADLFDIHLRENHRVQLKNPAAVDGASHAADEDDTPDTPGDKVDIESDESDESGDEEEEMDGDKDSNATTEIADDSDNDPDNCDGVRIPDESTIDDTGGDMGDNNTSNQEFGTGGDKGDNNTDTAGQDHEGSTKQETIQDINTVVKEEQLLESKTESIELVSTVENKGNENVSIEIDMDCKDVKLENDTPDSIKEEDLSHATADIKQEDIEDTSIIESNPELIDTETKDKEDALITEDNPDQSGSHAIKADALVMGNNPDKPSTLDERKDNDQSNTGHVDEKLKAVEKMLKLIDDPEAEKVPRIIKGPDYDMKTVYPESLAYKNKAKQLKRIMGTTYSGTCLLCNKTIPMKTIVSHIKSHSIVTLAKAKDALDMLGIKIHALQRPLFVCNLCNQGFKSCTSLSTHISKHFESNKQTNSNTSTGRGKKRTLLEEEDSEEKDEDPNPSEVDERGLSPAVSVDTDQTKSTSSGSILAAYLNAGPMYKSSSLARMVKESSKASKKQKQAKKDFKVMVPRPAPTIIPVVSKSGSVKENKEGIVSNAQSRPLTSTTVAVQLAPNLAPNSQVDSSVKEPAKPLQMMFLQAEKNQELKLVPASSVIKLSQEVALKGGHVLKVIPQGIIHTQLGSTRVSSSGDIDTNVTKSATPGDQSVGTTASIIRSIPSFSTSPSMVRNIMLAQSTDGGEKADRKFVPVRYVGNPGGSTAQEQMDQILGTRNQNSVVQVPAEKKSLSPSCVPVPVSLGIVNKGVLDSVSVGKVAEPLTRPTTTKQESTIMTSALPASIWHGHKLPVSLQRGQNMTFSLQPGQNVPPTLQRTQNMPVSVQRSQNMPVSVQRSQNIPVSVQRSQNIPVSVQLGHNVPLTVQPVQSLPVSLQSGQNVAVTLQSGQNVAVTLQSGQNVSATLQSRQNEPSLVSLQSGNSLPLTFQPGIKLPVGIQQGQVRLVSPVGKNQSTGQQQITILKWPSGLEMVRASSTPTVVKPQQDRISNIHIIQDRTSNIHSTQEQPLNIQLSTESRPLGAQTARTGTMTTSLPLESLLKKPRLVGSGTSVSVTTSTSTSSTPTTSAVKQSPTIMNVISSTSSAPSTSAVKQSPTIMNVMLSQYLQSQGVLTAPGAGQVNMKANNKASIEPDIPESVKGTAKKPTFNLVITQSPLTQPGVSNTYSTDSTTACTSVPNTQGESKPLTSSHASITSTTATNRLALVCNMCSSEIQNLEMIGQHVCPAPPPAISPPIVPPEEDVLEADVTIFPCISCNREFTDMEVLLLHQQYHHTGQKTLTCKMCSKVFPTESAYGAHMKTCHTRSMLFCPLCQGVFPDQAQCVEHLQTEHSTQTRCTLCPPEDKRLYLSMADLELHRIYDHPYRCRECQQQCADIEDFWEHIVTHTHTDTTPLFPPPDPDKIQQGHESGVICKKCLVGFVSMQTFQVHVRTHHLGEPIRGLMEDYREKCSVCDISYRTRKLLNHHMSNVHMRKVNYQCSVCKQYCATPSLLVLHLKEHKIIRPNEFEIVICHACHLVFPSKHLHTQHMQTNCLVKSAPGTSENLNTITTSDESRLVDPTSVVLKTDEFLVINTQTSVSSDSDLLDNDHWMMERNQTGYKCEACGMEGFKSKFLLKQHRVIRHLRPHPRTSASYYQHVLDNIKRPKAFDCIVCGKKFETKSLLKLHMKGHLRKVKSNFVCSYRGCRTRFNTRLSCLKHIKKCTYAGDRSDEMGSRGEGALHRHSVNCTGTKQRKLYGCAICKQGFYRLVKLTKHMWQHEEYDPGLPPLADKQSGDSHADTDQQAWFMCFVCLESFRELTTLFQHANSHLGQSELDRMAEKEQKHGQSLIDDPTRVPTLELLPGISSTLL